MTFAIQSYTDECGWITWMCLDDNLQEYPEPFDTRKQAEEAIAEELFDLQRAFSVGDIDFIPNEEHYRVIEIPD